MQEFTNQVFEMWTKNFDPKQQLNFNKFFDQSSWNNSFKAFTENNPFFTNFNNESFTKLNQNPGVFAFFEVNKLLFENNQILYKRQSEIVQKHLLDLYKLVQSIVLLGDPKAAVETHNQYVKEAFDAMVNDLKELYELNAKSNLEAFEIVSSKISETINNNTKTN